MLAIVDYGAGNLRSVANAIASLGETATITSRPGDILEARAVILPGVGAAADAMWNLKQHGLIEPLRQFIRQGRPFLGVCLGLQVLFTATEEGGSQECLNILPGQVRKLPSRLKIPHMGWNQVRQRVAHPIFDGIPDSANFYFVHSYHVVPDSSSLIAGETDYDVTFCSVVARGNVIGTQFHPEKSGQDGLQIYRNFIRLASAAA